MAGPGVSRSFLEEVIPKLNLNMKKKSFQKNRKKCYKQKDRTKDVMLEQQRESLLPQDTVANTQCYQHWVSVNDPLDSAKC